MIAALELGSGQPRLPPHLELGMRVHAHSQQALTRGDFRLEIVTVSRGAGVLTSRFLNVLAEDDRAALAASMAQLPCGDRDS